jgi:hypothetical protein
VVRSCSVRDLYSPGVFSFYSRACESQLAFSVSEGVDLASGRSAVIGGALGEGAFRWFFFSFRSLYFWVFCLFVVCIFLS